MSSPARRWRAQITGGVTGLVVAAAVVGSSALASGGTATTPPSATNPAPAAATDCGTSAAGGVSKNPSGPSDGPSPAPFLAAVAQLVQAGTISDSQARVLDADIRAGTIDSEQLVANGTLSSAQMQAVNDRLGAVKRSMAPAAQQGQVVKPDQRKRPHR